MHHHVSGRVAPEGIWPKPASLNAPHLQLSRGIGDYRTVVVGARSAPNELAWFHPPTAVLLDAYIDNLRPDPPFGRWKCQDRLCASARVAIVHPAGGETQHYQMAIEATARFRGLASRPEARR